MHEYPLAQSIIQTVEEYARAQGAAEVCAIHLVVGEQAGCVTDSLRLYFDIIAQGTLCENARLQIRPVTPKLRCPKCGQLFVRNPFSFACPRPGCPGEGLPTEIGKEFYIESIEITTA